MTDTVEAMQHLTFDEVAANFPVQNRAGLEASVNLGAGYLIKALHHQEMADNLRLPQQFKRNWRRDAQAFEQQAQTVGRVLDLNFQSSEVEHWFPVIRATAVEFLEEL